MSTQLCFTNKNARKKVCFDICHTCLDLFLTNVASFSNNCVFEVKSEVLALKNNQSLSVSFYVKIVALYTWQIWAVIFGCSESGAVNYSTLLLAFLMTRWSIGGGAQKKQECMGRPISRAGRSNEMLSQGKGSDEQQQFQWGNRTCSSKQGYELHASSLASWIYIVWTDMADIGR